MRTRSRLSAGVAVCLVVSAAELAAQGPLLSSEELERLMGRMTGTWELQPEKSMATSIPFPGREQVVTYDRAGENAVTYTQRGLDAEGHATHASGTQVFDGRPYPTEGTTRNRTVSRMPADEYTVNARITVDGELVTQTTVVFAGDGQRMTVILRNAEDHILAIRVYDKRAE